MLQKVNEFPPNYNRGSYLIVPPCNMHPVTVFWQRCVCWQRSSKVIKWFDTNMMEANPSKFQAITINAAEDPRAQIDIGDKAIITESTAKLFGVHLDDHLNFNQQTKELCRKAASQLNVLQRLARHLDQGCRVHLSSLHTDTLQLLCVSVALLRCNKRKETRAYPMQGTSLCIH